MSHNDISTFQIFRQNNLLLLNISYVLILVSNIDKSFNKSLSMIVNPPYEVPISSILFGFMISNNFLKKTATFSCC